MGKCGLCDNDSVGVCWICEKDLCEECLVPFTYLNQVDYDICEACYESNQEEKAEDELFEKLGRKEFMVYKKRKARINLIFNEIKKQS